MVETMSGSFTIQPTATPCQNLFAYYLFKQLKIDVPMTRVIGYHERDYKAVAWKLESHTFRDVPLQTRIANILNKPFWMVRQYSPSVSIDKLRGENAKE